MHVLYININKLHVNIKILLDLYLCKVSEKTYPCMCILRTNNYLE